MKKLISGLLALTLAASGSAVMASACEWQSVTAQGNGSNEVTLRWEPDAFADGYRIYKWDQAAGKYVTAKTVGGKWKSAAKITGLTAGTSYRFVIKSYYYDYYSNGGKGSEYVAFSNKSSAAIVSTVPGKVSITDSTRSSADAVRVFWTKYGFQNKVDDTASTNYAGYAIKWYNKNTLDYEDVAYVSGGRSNVRLNGCASGKKYTFKVTPYTVDIVHNEAARVMGTDSNAYSIKTKTYWCNC